MRLLSGLISRLQFEPNSLYRAELLGGNEWFGYGFDSARLGDLMDMLYLNTRASAQQKASYESIAPRPDPGSTKVYTTKKVKRVKDMDWGSALSQMDARF